MRFLSLVLALSLPVVVASAQAPTAEDRALARQHYERGIELFDEDNFDGALIEFEAAYRAVPNYRLLFNIGNVYAADRKAVEAVDAYERYLAEGGARIDAARRTQVEAALAAQRTRIGTVMITSNVEGATVTINRVDRENTTTPLSAPIRLSAGRYEVGLRLTGYQGPIREVTVAGQGERTVEIEMTRIVGPTGTLRIGASAPDVEVRVDGEVLGPAPQEIGVEPGEREVVGERAGYRVARERVHIEENETARVDLRMERDPDARPEDLGVVALTLPDADTTLRVDGETISIVDGRVQLPTGSHDVVLEVDERKPVDQTIDVPAGGELALAPRFEWTDSALGVRVNRASNFRVIGWVLGLAGTATVAVTVPLLVWSQSQASRWNSINDLYMQPGGCDDPAPTARGRDCEMEHGEELWEEYLDQDTANAELYRLGSIIGLSIGVAAAAVGFTLVLISDSDEDIEASASAPTASLRVGPGSLSLYGTF